MPPKIRLRPASWGDCVKLVKLRVTPGSVKAPVLKAVLLPKVAARIVAAAELKVEWPETYSGCDGVMRSGVQVPSTVVAALLSKSALWIASIGRHSPYAYFASHAAMAESASATFSCANSRTLAERLVPWCCAICAAMRSQWPGGV